MLERAHRRRSRARLSRTPCRRRRRHEAGPSPLRAAVEARGDDALEGLRQRSSSAIRARGRARRTARHRAGCHRRARAGSAARRPVSTGSSRRCAIRRAVWSSDERRRARSWSRSACRRPSPAGARGSSGRAVQTTSSGTSVTQSASSSTKSSSISSAQWRSSKTSTSGRCSASSSRKRRHAAKASLRAVASELGLVLQPDERAQVGLDPARRRRDPPRRRRRRRGASPRRRPRRVLLEDAGLRLDDLGERPEGDAVAVCKQRPCRQMMSSVSASAICGELVDQAALADARDADERHELRCALVARAVEGVSEHGQLAIATDELRPRIVRDVCAEARSGRPSASHTGDGSALPFASTDSASR